MRHSTYTLQQLADHTGIEIRTIRSYITKGLLRTPQGRGPNSYYEQDHLDRLHAIKLLRELFDMSLPDIRRILLEFPKGTVTIEAVRHRLDTSSTPAQDDQSDSPHENPPASDRMIARSPQFLMRGSWPDQDDEPAEFESNPSPQRQMQADRSDVVRMEKFEPELDSNSALEYLRGLRQEKTPEAPAVHRTTSPDSLLRILQGQVRPHQTKSHKREEWVQFEITPDIRLQVRGDFDVRQQAVFARIADAMREILLGGADHEPI